MQWPLVMRNFVIVTFAGPAKTGGPDHTCRPRLTRAP